MVSIITMAANALGGLFIGALKAFFSLISWFLKHFVHAVKMLFCALPVTATLFVGLFAINIVLLLSGSFKLSDSELLPAKAADEANHILENSSLTTARMYNELVSWWNETVYVLHGSPAYVILLIITVLMFLPVVCVLLCLSVFAGYGTILLFGVLADAALYLIRSFLGKSPLKQIQGRYFLLFREAGKKHDEKSYEKWLRRHRDEFESDEYEPVPRRSKVDRFYEDEDAAYSDEYEDEYEDDDEDTYEDDYDNEEYYEDELENDYEDEEYIEDSDYDDEDYIEDSEYDDEDEDIDDDYDERNHRRSDKQAPPPAVASSSFDFFAGCTSRESLDRKYKSLVKLYHPDNMDGDTSAIQEINVQYDIAKKSGRF